MSLFLVVGTVGVLMLVLAFVGAGAGATRAGMVTLTSVASFLAAFGFGAALVVAGGADLALGALVGLGAGLAVGGTTAWMTR
ncbi:MAG: hypothetical protein WAN48_01760 [Actinomycetes bacterium]